MEYQKILEVRYSDNFAAIISSQLRQLQPEYSWYRNPASPRSNEIWDTLQKFGCCGIESPNSWNSTRPKDFAPNQYPWSCCEGFIDTIEHKYSECLARIDFDYRWGCVYQLHEIRKIIYVIVFVFNSFISLIGVVAFIGRCFGVLMACRDI